MRLIFSSSEPYGESVHALLANQLVVLGPERKTISSELSSLNSAKNKGSICSFVAFFSTMGQIASKFSARALLTY
jgi:hypothetical protein